MRSPYVKDCKDERYIPGLLDALKMRAGPRESLLAVAERYLLAEAMVEEDGVQANAARELRISERMMAYLLRKQYNKRRHQRVLKEQAQRDAEAEQRLFEGGRKLRAV